MANLPLPADLKELTIDERIQLIEVLWESIASEQEAYAVTDAQKAELDRRLKAHAASPDDAIPWEEVRARLSPSS